MFSRIVSVLLGLAPLLGVAQNLVPNPGFESVTTCPNNIGQYNSYVGSWTAANTASPDYGACGFTGNTAIRTIPATGSAATGIWGGAAHPSCVGSAYVENVRANLTANMVAGQQYTVSFRIQVDGQGSSTATPNNCVNVGMYFFNTAAPPTPNGWCCFAVTPHFSVAGGSVVEGTYTQFTGTVTAAATYNAVMVGAFCNANTTTGACSNYNTARMYFNIDDVSIQPAVVLASGHARLQGLAHTGYNLLHWQASPGLEGHSLRLERSWDGEVFAALQSFAKDDLPTYRDDLASSAAAWYRLALTDPDGLVSYSNTVLLVPDENVASDHQLHFTYEPGSDWIRFGVELEEGGPLKLEAWDMQGRMIKEMALAAHPGYTSFEVPVQEIASGMYILRVHATRTGAFWQNKWVR